MFSLSPVVAARPVVEYLSTADAAGPAPTDPRLPEDKVSLSPEARRELRDATDGAGGPDATRRGAGKGPVTGTDRPDGQAQPPGPGKKLDAEQQAEVVKLQQRDQHVRQHEAAHQAAGGDLTGQASFSYQTGPDGRSYAIGGEVPISARSGRTADETIAIARRVRAAALAPADPSPADLSAAASAMQLEQKAMQQKRAEQAEETAGSGQLPGRARDAAGIGPPSGQPSGPQAGTLERLLVRTPARAPEPSYVT